MENITAIGTTLVENGLDQTFWAEKFQKVGFVDARQLKHADEKVFNELLKDIQHSWEENALRSCFPEIKKKAKPLEDVLDTNNLDRKFWIEKFRDVGINNGDVLQHADEKVFNKLCRQKRYTWEENALRACFPLISKPCHEETVFSEERHQQKEPKIKGPLEEDLAEREKLTSTEIISKISSGRILRGYYIHTNVWQRVLPRKQLITIPENVEMLAPRKEESFSSREFFSEEKAMIYDHVLKHWGLNATASVGAIGVFTADIGYSINSAEGASRSKISKERFTQINETVFVPTASFSLENVSYSISMEALDELIKLENRLTQENSKELCADFFRIFGSHYFAGTSHFGGRFTKTVICRTETKMTEGDSIKLTKRALQGGGSGIIEWFMFKGHGQFEKRDNEQNVRYQEDVDYKIEKKIVKCGGPPEADSIAQWKLGLVKYPSTWNIIDQDANKEEWKGVWDLLKDDLSSKFKNIEELRSTLKQNWEAEFKSTYDECRKIKENATPHF